jgi:ATP-dependent Lon protease
MEKMQQSCATVGIDLSWEFDEGSAIHARHIITDHGWKILLERGLDIFHPYEMNDTFAISNRLQRYRPCKAFEVTYLKIDEARCNNDDEVVEKELPPENCRLTTQELT